MNAIQLVAASVLVSITSAACNQFNFNFASNTDLCTGQVCSVDGYTNSCQSGCCVGGYCRNTSNCKAAVAVPVIIAVLVLAYGIFVVVIAYRRAEFKRA